ncbi:sigma-70 family RNA polymerase sigma factor [Pseudoduganella sp. SL102]|uniref:sigma-70 family RNA polymerase sigma factor n=1 Tax=Pseudoduganella sp. SL102 TaxID=2995154 RepID=UPI00248BF157|nr:sigma-70 family RNA polymerase sigma factor [Pseudoduganella sp. SL102]WBS00385.1 sigma-70 family RNA polymerase sigma factor [Pseudoduganella sp. SL102]
MNAAPRHSNPLALRNEWLSSEFRRSYGWLTATVHRLVGSRNDAEDLAASTFTELAALDEVGRVRQPRALLTTIARRLTYEFWRRRDLERAWLAELAQRPEGHGASAEEVCMTVEEIVRIDAALATLSAKAREAFILSQFEELGYAEIAARLGVSTSMVRKYVAQALAACWPAA